MIEAYKIKSWYVRNGSMIPGSEHVLCHKDRHTDRLFKTSDSAYAFMDECFERDNREGIEGRSYAVIGPKLVSDKNGERLAV